MSQSQPGNQSAKKGKEWFDAIRKQCVQRGALDKIAKVVVDKAIEGEQWAVLEIGNRMDGKPVQGVELGGPDGGPIEHAHGLSDALKAVVDRLIGRGTPPDNAVPGTD